MNVDLKRATNINCVSESAQKKDLERHEARHLRMGQPFACSRCGESVDYQSVRRARMGAGRVKIVDMCPNTLTIDKKTKEVVQIMSRESKFSECGFFLKLQRRPKKKKENG